MVQKPIQHDRAVYHEQYCFLWRRFMRKFFIVLFAILFAVNSGFCADEHCLKFNGTEYILKYSVKDKDNNGYLNEYFKEGESYTNWSEMVAVHHFPNIYSPIDQLKAFRDYLNIINCPNYLEYNEEKNTGLIDFIMMDGRRLPIILEFNIFKYQKSSECGTIAVQYVKRYLIANSLQVKDVKKELEKSRKKYLKKVDKFEIPLIVEENIDEIKLNDLP